MNPILQVKLRFANEANTNRPGTRNLRKKAETTAEKIDNLCEDLNAILRFYKSSPRFVKNILVDAHYNDIIAKSNRIRALIKPEGKEANDMVVGARFSEAPVGEENHIITYYVDEVTIKKAIENLEIAKRFLNEKLSGKATFDNFNEPKNILNYNGFGISKSKIRDIIVDCSVIDSFSRPQIANVPDKELFLITFYKTELSMEELLEKLKIDGIRYKYSFYGDDTMSADKELYDILETNVPYLISMVSSDLSQVTLDDITKDKKEDDIYIPEPSNEPIIGVIDTLFDESVYFANWVENTDYLNDIERMVWSDRNREHGTQVSSIIVDGPRMNPWMDDGCGRFKVRHFGVCVDKIQTSRLVKKITEIVNNNPDIHVWNLSLGTEDEVSKNFVSYDAAFLDELQAKKNIVFVVSGTNDNRDEKNGILKIGSPADSLNSIVVNSVRRDGTPASYSRKGNVLSFFNKPDISYYGGDYNERIKAYSCCGEEEVYGTSFAAPWISRKLCYLIDVMGLPREVAKSLIIDSAAGWEYKTGAYRNKEIMGYGIVPIDIAQILSTENNEIKFILYGTSESYKTTNYAIPVPRNEDNKYPYIARATMCYFPECSRSQGVDYTNRELSLKFGRVMDDGKIDDINENIQDEDGSHADERKSRKEFRKWENTKFISKILKANRPLKSYGDRLWGITVTTKERLNSKMQKELNFGAVITLREINGVNRIQDFISACNLRGWIVNELDVQSQVDIYNANQEEILFD
ncbi:type VII secretion-associated serine protease mycosin [uncultured Eubacterium sp.]|nr:type VII secretion-associated serine protease mycosin [uncultured Eubacterium sp.]